MPTHTISFRITDCYYQQLSKQANNSDATVHQLAKKFVVTAIENPDLSQLTADVYQQTVNSELLLAELRQLRQEYHQLKASMAAATELLLTNLGGVEPETAQDVISKLFYDDE